MIVTPHVATGLAIGLAVHRPWLAFLLALGSHFILDVIPHWDPNMDEPKIAYPFLLGDLTVSTVLFLALLEGHESMLVALGAATFGAVLPDLLDVGLPYVGASHSPHLRSLHVRFARHIGPAVGIGIQVIYLVPLLYWLFVRA